MSKKIKKNKKHKPAKKIKKVSKVKKVKKIKKIKKIKKKALKSPKKKKVSGSKIVSAKKTVLTEDVILSLIEKGKHRGFVTQSEIINTFPNLEKDIKGLEMLYERLESAN